MNALDIETTRPASAASSEASTTCYTSEVNIHLSSLIPVASANQDSSLTADEAFQALCDSLLAEARASGSAATAESQAGRVFEQEVARAYLLLSPDYEHLDPHVTQFTDWARENPDWSETTTDQGIDLILRTSSRAKPSPVQVKFLTGDEYTQSSLPRTKLDALTAETRVPGRIDKFDKPMIVTNARSFTRHAHKRIADEGLVAHNYDWFVSVNTAIIENGDIAPTTLAELLALEVKVLSSESGAIQAPQIPREYQVEATAHVQKVLESSDCTTVHMACGTGKTLVSWMLFNERVATGETGVVFVPSLSLVRKAISTFMQQSTADVRYDILAVCSDKTVLNKRGAKPSIEGDIRASDLNASDITSNPAVIAEWLSKPSTGRRLMVATYQSSALVKEAAAAANHTFSLLVGDEAHRLVGESGIFGDPIWGVASKKNVFMTATPKVTVGDVSAKTDDVKVESMSDASKFGDEKDWFTYTTSQGVADEILAPYHISVYVAHEDDELTGVSSALTTAINLSDEVIDSVSTQRHNVTARMAVAANQCAKSMRESRDGKGIVIVFFSRTKDSKAFVEYLKATYPDVPAEHIDGTMNTDDRDTARRRIDATGGVLSNVRVLNEGIDIPALGTVIFGTPKSSKVDIVQGVGRVLRRDPQNPDKVGEIVIPIVLPADVDDSDIDGLIENTAFASLWTTVRALADNDDTILKMLVVIKNPSLAGTSDGAGGTYPSSEAARAGCDSILKISAAGNRLNQALSAGDGDLLSRFADSISTRMLRSMGGNWMNSYAEVLEYMTEHGKKPNEDSVDPYERRLGIWCDTYRVKERNGTLSARHVALLELLPFWVWSQPRDDHSVERTPKNPLSKNTLAAYRSAVRSFKAWTILEGGSTSPATLFELKNVALYLTNLAERGAPSTVEIHRSGIFLAADEAGFGEALRTSSWLRGMLQDMRREGRRAWTTIQSPSLTRMQIHAMADSCSNTLAGRRDRVYLLLSVALGLRPSDAVNLTIGDVHWIPEGAEITVGFSMDISEPVVLTLASLPPASAAVDACVALRSYMDALTALDEPMEDSAPLLRAVMRGGWSASKTPISPAACSNILHTMAARAGVEVDGLSPQSCRATFANGAVAAGISEFEIARTGRWTSITAFRKYDRTTQQADNGRIASSWLGVE